MGQYVFSMYRGHDCSAALVGEGRIIHLEMERLTRKKHDGWVENRLANQVLDLAGIGPDQIVALVGMGCAEDMGVAHASRGNRQWWSDDTGGLNVVDKCEGQIFNRTYPCYYIPHHAAHAAYAFYTSRAETARVIAVDGGGDAWKDADDPQQWVIDACAGVVSQPFGSKRCEWDVPIVRQVQIGGRWNDTAEELFGSWHCAGSVMALGGVPVGEFVDQGTSDRIRALQSDTTAAFHSIANTLTPHRTIALGGGCALNGIAAYSLLRRDDVDSVWVPPAVHDGGLTVGAALMGLHRILGFPRVPYWEGQVAFAGYTNATLNGFPPIDQIVGRLVKGKVVALAHGQAESGPRALGHRSFLADPRAPGMKDRLNQIKGRQPWRPVAPVILAEHAGQYFDILDPDGYHFMTTICAAKDRAREELPAAVHTDGTARVQIVRGGPLCDILERFYEATGCPALLNTSFNCKGEAMVNDEHQARDTFKRSGADCLVIGSKMVVE